ncbi:MAG: DUF6732 family protein [Pseudomonadota bacterium]
MRPTIACLTVIFALAANPALAHPGHFAELAGHSHWIALGALVAAGALTAWLLGQKDEEEADDEEEAAEEDPEEVEA